MVTKIIKNIFYLLHLNIARSKILSELYLNLLSIIVKPFPDTKIKQQILNSINSVNWQNLDLQAQNIIVGEKIQFKIIPHIQEFDCQSLLVKKSQYEAEVFDYLDKHIDKFDSIIEIGANVGIFTIYFYESFVKHNKNIKIFAFEPSQKAYLRLLKNLEINQASGVQTYNSAIGDKVGFLDFFEPEGHLTNGSLNKEFADLFSEQVNSNKALVINASYLSELVNVDERVLVKIDVEGSEFEVLSSLKGFIVNQKPTLIIEVLHTYEQALNELKFLHENYTLYNLTTNGLIKHSKFEASSCRDYLLEPK